MAGDQPGPGGRNDWRVRLATAVGAGSGAGLGLLVGPQIDPGGGFWQGLVLFLCFVIAGMLLGRLAGAILFRRPPGGSTAEP